MFSDGTRRLLRWLFQGETPMPSRLLPLPPPRAIAVTEPALIVTPPRSEPIPAPTDPWHDNPEAQEALRMLRETNEHVILTGPAGTGKSRLLATWREKARPVVAAPTAFAARLVRGATVHSLFGLAPKLQTTDQLSKRQAPRHLSGIDTVVVDEASMVRADLFDAVAYRLSQAHRNFENPTGGVRLVLIGDPYQLPPIIPRDLAHHFTPSLLNDGFDHGWWWAAQTNQKLRWARIDLKRVYRQDDARFVALLGRMRNGTAGADDYAELNQRVAPPVDDAVVLVGTNRQADRINLAKLEALTGDRHTFSGRLSLVALDSQDASWPAPINLSVAVGARVMFVRNAQDTSRPYINGDTGVVVDFRAAANPAAERITVLMDRPPRNEVHVQRTIFEDIGYRFDLKQRKTVDYVRATLEQFPLNLAWARTIHKCQGQTMKAVHLDLGARAFAPGMTYVALSRVRAAHHLTLQRPVSSDDVFVDPEVTRWMGEA
jgi:ATP-dependent DNA helicase PIF1